MGKRGSPKEEGLKLSDQEKRDLMRQLKAELLDKYEPKLSDQEKRDLARLRQDRAEENRY